MTVETQQQVRKRVQLEVQSIAKAEGRFGAQWQLEVVYPWSQYPTKAWIDRSQYPNEPGPGRYWSLVERVRLRDGKSGDQEYDYNWRIIGFDVAAPEAAPEAAPAENNAPQAASSPGKPRAVPVYPEDTNRADHPTKRRSIERQSAFNLAIQCKDMTAEEFEIVRFRFAVICRDIAEHGTPSEPIATARQYNKLRDQIDEVQEAMDADLGFHPADRPEEAS